MSKEINHQLVSMHTMEIRMKEIMSVDGEMESKDEWFGAAGTQMTVEGEESLILWMVVGEYGICSLNDSEHKEEETSRKRDNSPWISEVNTVSVKEIGAPHIPRLSAVVIHPLMHNLKAAIWVLCYILRE